MLKNLLTKSAGYYEEDTKLMYEGIVEERKERELLEERKRRDNLELEKLRIEAQIGLNQEILKNLNKRRGKKEQKRRSFKERHLDEWPSINGPVELGESLEEFEDVRRTLKQKKIP
ncbi:hypothetical protein TNCV_3684951 [Trichonephila clavipes]|uniref:Uncharacterized protein n=1 Tax=Trichonephila clavipes TaxID=2585209 RepID=A0A8X6V180_TRICX|nr:hypothetical protein TNCV_3684951 [Trichonephila clavipes]